MRASPACQVSLRRFGAWRLGVSSLVLAAAAVTAGWALSRAEPVPAIGWFAIGAMLALTFASGVSLWLIPPLNLRWDGHAWQLGALSGEVRVAIDLGPWMLLVFEPRSVLGARPARASWLPVQRRGLEPEWHALRCAVYSPRPAAAEA